MEINLRNNTCSLPKDIKSILLMAREFNLSDVHINPDMPVYVRSEGQICVSDVVFNQKHITKILSDLEMPAIVYGRLQDELSTDFTYNNNLVGRFRVNVTRYGDSDCLSIRTIDNIIRTPEELGFNDSLLNDIKKINNGLIVFTGTTSSGKSTSLNSFLKYAMPKGRHIITLNNPIEAILDVPGSAVTQLEYGRDFRSFEQGVSICMRKDPDIISVAEMRDIGTIKAGILAAETGHLVFATTHTQGVDETINRLLGAFSGDDLRYMEMLIKSVLKIVVSQELVYNEVLGRRELKYEYKCIG